MSLTKINAVRDRLITKMKLSQTPIPGFIMGLSGTDSAVAFDVCYHALAAFGMEHRLVGIHYVRGGRAKPTWFEEHMIPWMRERYPRADISVTEPQGGNQDQQRWADLQLRALNRVQPDNGRVKITSLDFGENFWTVGTINATEMYLGKYSILANATSVQAIRNIWKSEIMVACAEMGMPEIAMETARLPDCLCGRDELAALNIEVIDDIIRNRLDPTQHDPELLKTLIAYVRDTKAENDFKLRTPFVP
jgi:NH3-dependent NAD+ synthetase